MEYTFDDGLVVLDTVTGSKGQNVDCSMVCDLYCCLASLESEIEGYRTTNQIEFAKKEALFEQIMSRVVLMQNAVYCGKPEDANDYMVEIKSLAFLSDSKNPNSYTVSMSISTFWLKNSPLKAAKSN